MHAPTAAPLHWFPPRSEPRRTGADWEDWQRWLRRRTGVDRRALLADADAAEQLCEQWRGLSEDELDERLARLRSQTRLDAAPANPRERRVQSVAAIAVTAGRVLGQRPYRVQMLTAMAMQQGLVVQMAAGEGKTLAVAVAGVLHGWRGLPCHVVTANDYLAQRDVQLMGPLYQRCGVSVVTVLHGMPMPQLQAAYRCDVVYATSKQLLADHLCDHIALQGATDPTRRRIHALRGESGAVRTRGLHVAIVDEADSVLIDEANTPLIISAPEPNAMLVAAVRAARDLADELQGGRDYDIDPLYRDVQLKPAGVERIEAMVQRLPPVWHAPERRDDLVRQAISAREVFLRDRHYVVQEGKIEILDENTGRVLPGRSWSYGLHQAIEARAGLEITHPSKTMARMSFQEFFRHYHQLGGASGTLQDIRRELWWTYGLLTLEAPTRLPSRLTVPPPMHFADGAAKWQALVQTVERLHRENLPVLVGTRRLSDSEVLEQRLLDRGLPCVVLNAKQSAQEAEVVAQAGKPGRITVATNMAGRGTDIHIGPDVAARGGLQVLMLEPHDSRRVDWQLFGRAGRQGQPGRAQGFVALDDDLLRRHLPSWLAPLRGLLAGSPRLRERLIGACIRLAQGQAQQQAFQQRRYLQQRERELRRQLSFTGDGST